MLTSTTELQNIAQQDRDVFKKGRKKAHGGHYIANGCEINHSK